MSKNYHQAQICVNGHMVNGYIDKKPEHNLKHCNECGAKTITNCPKCQAHINGFPFNMPYGDVPKHCHECGESYPWNK